VPSHRRADLIVFAHACSCRTLFRDIKFIAVADPFIHVSVDFGDDDLDNLHLNNDDDNNDDYYYEADFRTVDFL
jgi:hypothetical protein